MSEYNKAITELRKKISMQNTEIHETKKKIGNELSLLKPDKIKDTPLFENFQKTQELKKIIPVKKKAIQEIKKIDKKIEGLNKNITELKNVLSEHEKAYKAIYENIGKTAFAAFKENRKKLHVYENIFTGLIKQDVKCEKFNRVDISGGSEEKNIIKQFIDAAKSMYRNQKHKILLLRYSGLYRQAGKAILTTDFVEDAGYGALDEAMKPLIQNEKIILQLNNDMDKNNKEKEELLKKLVSLDVQGKSGKKIQEITDEIQQMEKALNECYVTMGALFIDHNLSHVIDNEKTGEYIRVVDDLQNKNHEYKKEISRYETLIEIDKINHKLMRTTNKIEHAKNTIAKQEQELVSLQKEFTRLEKQKKRLEKTLQPQKADVGE